MISPTYTAPAVVHGAAPVTESGPLAPRGFFDTKSPSRTPAPPATVPPPVANDLTRFLYEPCMEIAVNLALQPEIAVSNLRDPATFDAVLRRSRGALLAATGAGGPSDATLKAAIDALDRNAALRSYSRIVRNALYQG